MKALVLILLATALCACSPDTQDFSPPSPPTDQPDKGENGGNTNPPQTANNMKITIGTTSFSVKLAQNATVEAFGALLPLTLDMSDFNRNEKVGSLSRSLPTAASNPGTIRAGDLMLYGSSSVVLFYETFATSYSYTRLGTVDNPEGLKEALGTGNVTIKFESLFKFIN